MTNTRTLLTTVRSRSPTHAFRKELRVRLFREYKELAVRNLPEGNLESHEHSHDPNPTLPGSLPVQFCSGYDFLAWRAPGPGTPRRAASIPACPWHGDQSGKRSGSRSSHRRHAQLDRRAHYGQDVYHG